MAGAEAGMCEYVLKGRVGDGSVSEGICHGQDIAELKAK